MENFIEVLAGIDSVLFPVWSVVCVGFLRLAVRDIVRQKGVGVWGQKAIVAALARMLMMAPFAGLIV